MNSAEHCEGGRGETKGETPPLQKASRGPPSRDGENAPRRPGAATAFVGEKMGHGGLPP